MTATLVDANVLLDLATRDPVWIDWSTARLAEMADAGELVINALIFAEVSVAFTRIESLEMAVPRHIFRREDLPYEAAFLAGKAHLAYRRRGGTRTSPLPDFFIGAHAAVRGYRLLTRDPRCVASYSPSVVLMAPGRA